MEGVRETTFAVNIDNQGYIVPEGMRLDVYWNSENGVCDIPSVDLEDLRDTLPAGDPTTVSFVSQSEGIEGLIVPTVWHLVDVATSTVIATHQQCISVLH